MTHYVKFTVSTKPDISPSEVKAWILDLILAGCLQNRDTLGNISVPEVSCPEYIDPTSVITEAAVSDNATVKMVDGVITEITITNKGPQ